MEKILVDYTVDAIEEVMIDKTEWEKADRRHKRQLVFEALIKEGKIKESQTVEIHDFTLLPKDDLGY